jgi:hypothetical protein
LLILFVSSVFVPCFTLPNYAIAADMPGGSMGGGGSDQSEDSTAGGNDNDDDDSNSMPQDAPLTTDTLTAGGDSDNEDDDSEPIPKDAPVTTDTLTAKKIECPPGREVTLFSTSCSQIGGTENPGNTGSTSTPTECRVS